MRSCMAVRAERFLATSSTPEVSRSSRWTSSRKRACGSHAVRGLDPLAVDAHLAAPHDAVDAALRHALQARDEIVVDALPRFVFAYLDPAHRQGRQISVFAIRRHAGILISS